VPSDFITHNDVVDKPLGGNSSVVMSQVHVSEETEVFILEHEFKAALGDRNGGRLPQRA